MRSTSPRPRLAAVVKDLDSDEYDDKKFDQIFSSETSCDFSCLIYFVDELDEFHIDLDKINVIRLFVGYNYHILF